VIVDRASHDVAYFRAYLKHAMLNGTYVINNPFWWTADDKFFNYAAAAKLGVAVPRTVLLPQKGYPRDADVPADALRNLEFPLNWEALIDVVGLPAILKPFTGGGWKHVYKVHSIDELLAAYDGTAPHCMMLQEFIPFDRYVRCFTFGRTDIVPAAHDPNERRYLDTTATLEPALLDRIVADARTINEALGYEMNSVEFAIKDGVPWAIDFFNPVPDFEPDHITPAYFEVAVDRMARLAIDRALHGAPSETWPMWPRRLNLSQA
jgi:glutathione synthase/RimK-type ligase-like ATP-grasp enzyme